MKGEMKLSARKNSNNRKGRVAGKYVQVHDIHEGKCLYETYHYVS